jgi:hypothetical protein
VPEEVLEAEAIEEPAGPVTAGESGVRALAQRRGSELDAWRGEVRTVAIAAAGGIAAGAATFAAVSAVRSRAASKRPSRGIVRRGKDRQGVVASRSFLVDVHVLGR